MASDISLIVRMLMIDLLTPAVSLPEVPDALLFVLHPSNITAN